MVSRAYFDHAAATPLMPEARAAMLPFLDSEFGNPASLHHAGAKPCQAVETARAQVATLISARPEEIVFESSASEANNHAVKGLALSRMDKGRHVVVSSIEHASVLESARGLKRLGFEITELPVSRDGLVSPETLTAAIRPDTALVSIMHANYEIGVVQDIAELARICRDRQVPLHSDGTAAIGRLLVDVAALGVDSYAFPAQSVSGPNGAAALYVRRGTRLRSLVEGGFQEKNRRAGTENVAAIAGFGAAAEVTAAGLASWSREISRLSRRIIAELPARLDHVVLTGPKQDRLPGQASFCVEFVEGEAMLLFLDDEGIAAASGSSCTAKTLKASHVLLALGLPHALAQSSLVLTLGKDSTDAEVDYFLDKLPPIVQRLRQMSPLYARHLKGEDPYAVRPGAAEDDAPAHAEES